MAAPHICFDSLWKTEDMSPFQRYLMKSLTRRNVNKWVSSGASWYIMFLFQEIKKPLKRESRVLQYHSKECYAQAIQMNPTNKIILYIYIGL